MNITRPGFALGAPKEQAHASPARIDDVSRKLESQFTQMLVKCMRDASMGNPLMPEDNQTYRDLYDRQLADMLSQGKGLGLRPLIARQLGGGDAAQPAAPGKDASSGKSATGLPLDAPSQRSVAFFQRFPAGKGSEAALDAIAGRSGSSAVQARAVADGAAPALGSDEVPLIDSAACDDVQAVAETDPSQFKPGTPEHFVAKIWPHAQRAARELGVDPRALVAQAALETGWGRRGIRGGNGSDANNLFGIKATGWSGARVNTATHEYVDGSRRAERADFRAYASPADSFDDYVRLLKSSPRYQQALKAGTDVRRFAHELQRAGYATDPSYAKKIYAIANGATLGRALNGATAGNLVASR